MTELVQASSTAGWPRRQITLPDDLHVTIEVDVDLDAMPR